MPTDTYFLIFGILSFITTQIVTMKKHHFYKLILLGCPLLYMSCGGEDPSDKDAENTPATIEILYPRADELNYITSISQSDYMVFLLSDPEENGKHLKVTGNGSVIFELNDNPIYYDAVPDTLFGLSSIISPDNDGLIKLQIEVEDLGDVNTLANTEISFSLAPDVVTISNPKITYTDVVEVEFDVATSSGELGSIVSFNFTTADEDFGNISNFGWETYYCCMNEFNCNNCSSSQPVLTSHFKTNVVGDGVDSGKTLYVHAYVIDYANSQNSTTNYRYEIGVLP